MSTSIIVPMLNELRVLPTLLQRLTPFRRADCEVLIVDGGSDDGSAELARRCHGDQRPQCPIFEELETRT